MCPVPNTKMRENQEDCPNVPTRKTRKTKAALNVSFLPRDIEQSGVETRTAGGGGDRLKELHLNSVNVLFIYLLSFVWDKAAS